MVEIAEGKRVVLVTLKSSPVEYIGVTAAGTVSKEDVLMLEYPAQFFKRVDVLNGAVQTLVTKYGTKIDYIPGEEVMKLGEIEKDTEVWNQWEAVIDGKPWPPPQDVPGGGDGGGRA